VFAAKQAIFALLSIECSEIAVLPP